MSAIVFFHKLFHLPDPTGEFLVRHILLGAHKEFSHVDSRLPITIPILHALCDSTCHVTQTSYHACLVRVIYLFVFHAFLRIGEVTNSRNNIKCSQLTVLSDSLIIVFQQFKHHFSSHISTSIPSSQNAYCPVAALSLCSLPGGATVKALCSVSRVYPPPHHPFTVKLLAVWLVILGLSPSPQHKSTQLPYRASYSRLSSGIFLRTDPTDGPLGIFRFQKIYSHHLFRNTVSFHCIYFSAWHWEALGGVQLSCSSFSVGVLGYLRALCLPSSSAFGRGLGYNTRQSPCCKSIVRRNLSRYSIIPTIAVSTNTMSHLITGVAHVYKYVCIMCYVYICI